MAEKSSCYSTVVPFSCIPEEFLQPLILEDAGDYTIDDTQFPGLSGEEHRLQPALILAHPDKYHVSQTENYPPHVPNRSPIPHGNVAPEMVYQQQQHHREETLPWINYCHQYAGQTPNTNHGFSQVEDNSSYKKSACENITKAREDLFTIISGIQHNEFPRSTNPFDTMPALLSAVSFDYMSNHSAVQDTCPSKSRAYRQHYAKRKLVSQALTLQKSNHISSHPQISDFKNNVESVSQILNHGQNRKRSYQVDDLDDILQCDEYGTTKRRRILDTVSQCWSFQKENLPTGPYNPRMQLGTNLGIMGY